MVLDLEGLVTTLTLEVGGEREGSEKRPDACASCTGLGGGRNNFTVATAEPVHLLS